MSPRSQLWRIRLKVRGNDEQAARKPFIVRKRGGTRFLSRARSDGRPVTKPRRATGRHDGAAGGGAGAQVRWAAVAGKGVPSLPRPSCPSGEAAVCLRTPRARPAPSAFTAAASPRGFASPSSPKSPRWLLKGSLPAPRLGERDDSSGLRLASQHRAANLSPAPRLRRRRRRERSRAAARQGDAAAAVCGSGQLLLADPRGLPSPLMSGRRRGEVPSEAPLAPLRARAQGRCGKQPWKAPATGKSVTLITPSRRIYLRERSLAPLSLTGRVSEKRQG